MDDPAKRTPRPAPVRLADVATRAGVSNSTVSLVLNGSGPVSPATRARVLAAATELGYAGPDPRARSLRRGRSGIVAVVLEDPLSSSFRDPVNIALLDGLAGALQSSGLSLLLIPDAIEDPARLASAPLDAAVLLGCSSDVSAALQPLLRRRVPLAAVEAPHLPGVVAIDLDNRESSAAGARHLRDLGHERVALVTLQLGPDRLAAPLTPEREAAAEVVTTRERLAGTRDVFPGAWGRSARSSTVADGREAGLALLDVPADERPTAIIAQSDLLAVGVLHAAEELGIEVPGDLSVVGFDGVRLDGLTHHTLTTLWQPSVEKGTATGAALLAALAGERPRGRVFQAELRVGTTTGPAPVSR